MAQSTHGTTKRSRPNQAGTSINVRLQPDQLAEVDAWIARQTRPAPSRPEAIRTLIGIGLDAKKTNPFKRP